jgi:DNA-binding transcriptional MerR regulator
VRIFNAVEHDEQGGSREHFVETGILMRRPEGDDALVGDALGHAVERIASFEADWDGMPAAQFDDFLYARPGGTLGDDDLIEWPAGAERFPNRVDAKRETHVTFDRSGSSIVKRHVFYCPQAIFFVTIGAAPMLPMIDGALPTRDGPDIPNKLYFRIGEVAKLAGIKTYVLRFWETEFPGLGPKKSGTGHRLYRRKDVELVLEIKRLLYEKRFTIEGARKFLGSQPKSSTGKSSANPRKQRDLFDHHPPQLEEIRKELAAILQFLTASDIENR